MNSNTLAVTPQIKPSALAVMASRYNVEPAKLLSTLKDTVFKGASESELVALVIVANEYGLNPLTKQIYAFPAKGGGITPIVSIDGWLRVINSHPQMDGVEFDFEHSEAGQLVACTCRIWRKDRNRAIAVTEYLAETRRNTDPWKMEHRMLRHKALIQCGRVAFGLAGIFDEDEAERIQTVKIESRVKSLPKFEAVAEPEKQPEIVTDSPQGRLSKSLADCNISEESAIAWMKKKGVKTSAQHISDIDDAIANDAIANFSLMQGDLE